jgi:glycosyltransferase involved in cell wall biosynthesis
VFYYSEIHERKTKGGGIVKVLMFGWEFPPFMSGGLGTACYGLTKGLSKQNVEVTFVMPTGPSDMHHAHLRIVIADKLALQNVKFKTVNSILQPYQNSESYVSHYRQLLSQQHNQNQATLYGNNIYEEVWRFSEMAKLIAQTEDFDVIHCHDWMTYLAGVKAKEVSGKPLVVHVHATEFDRSGFNGVNQHVYDLERQGMHAADRVITVSNYTKGIVNQHYGISEDKIDVVHNAVEFGDLPKRERRWRKGKNEKTVLFLGRITLQKGPDYFIEAAKRVIDKDQDVRFIVAGSGDMEARMIERAAELGISKNVLFSGFLRGADVDRAYRMADLYVMPSVSEPFGITPLEAMRNGTPVIISHTSGVSEVIKNCLKIDFWDINEMSSNILSVLHYGTLHNELQENGEEEVRSISWDDPAKKTLSSYHKAIDQHRKKKKK